MVGVGDMQGSGVVLARIAPTLPSQLWGLCSKSLLTGLGRSPNRCVSRDVIKPSPASSPSHWVRCSQRQDNEYNGLDGQI